MIPVAIAINIAIGQLVYTLKVPLYLDSIGTIFVGAVAGPIAGLVTGALTNLIWGLSGINSFPVSSRASAGSRSGGGPSSPASSPV